MPSRYLEKIYGAESFYHVFNRGVAKRKIFVDDSDYNYFLYLLKRYLGKELLTDAKNRPIPNYSHDMELVAYCLMPNHFHMLLYQETQDVIEKFFRSIGTAYSMYFNKKYKRVGSLFQDRYKAVHIDDDPYLTHISRYIHLNPLDIGKDYKKYGYSSLQYWLHPKTSPSWLKPSRGRAEFQSAKEYSDFLKSYESVKEELDEIKKALKDY